MNFRILQIDFEKLKCMSNFVTTGVYAKIPYNIIQTNKKRINYLYHFILEKPETTY